jgi:hypothetical protein
VSLARLVALGSAPVCCTIHKRNEVVVIGMSIDALLDCVWQTETWWRVRGNQRALIGSAAIIERLCRVRGVRRSMRLCASMRVSRR